MTLFGEIAIALVLSALIGIVMHALKQPTVVGFVLAGLLIGALGVSEIQRTEIVDNLSSIGVALLLFIVGLEMDIRYLKHIGIPSLYAGLGQIFLTFILGVALSQFFGFTLVVSLYLATALSFSSTIIVIKLLSERRELSSLYGQITTGILLVQDLVAILVLVFLAGFSGGGSLEAAAIPVIAKGIIFLALTVLFSRILPKFLDFLGGSVDLLFLFSLAWAIGVSALASFIGLSVEIGGLLAGLSLSTSSENFQIAARLRSIRDFFLILFFVGLGAKLNFREVSMFSSTAVAMSLFVLIGRPITTLLTMGLLGYRSRTSFLTGLALAQVSEFSLVIVAVGYRLGHLGASEFGLVTLITIVTIFASSYLVAYGTRLYQFFRPVLKIFEFRARLESGEKAGEKLENHIVLVGVNRMGKSILKALIQGSNKFVALDFNPMIVKSLKEKNVPVVYGDVADSDIRDLIALDKARVVISTVPEFKDNLIVLSFMNKNNPQAKVVVSAQNEFEARALYNLGADYVLLPHFVGGEEMARTLREDSSLANLSELKNRDFGLFEEF